MRSSDLLTLGLRMAAGVIVVWCRAGIGILVSTKAKPTAAAFTVRDPEEVAAFLKMLVQYGTSSGNGWWTHQDACNGWAPAHLRHSSSAPAGLAALADAAPQLLRPVMAPAGQTDVTAAVAAAVLRPAAAAAAAAAAAGGSSAAAAPAAEAAAD
jgi:hypothetical protein